MKRKTTNPRVLGLIKSLYEKSAESKAALWKNLAKQLESPRQNWAEVNMSRLSRVTKKGETIVIPGKLLGTGNIGHSLHVFSVSASKAAAEKVKSKGGSYGRIEEVLARGVSKGVRIVK